jgi:hypothetical protein
MLGQPSGNSSHVILLRNSTPRVAISFIDGTDVSRSLRTQSCFVLHVSFFSKLISLFVRQENRLTYGRRGGQDWRSAQHTTWFFRRVTHVTVWISEGSYSTVYGRYLRQNTKRYAVALPRA